MNPVLQLLNQWAYIITVSVFCYQRIMAINYYSGDQGYRSLLEIKQFVDLGCNSSGGQGGQSADVAHL